MIEEQRENIGALVPQENQPEPPQFEIGEHLTKWLADLWQTCERQDENDWRRVKAQMLRCRKYFEGHQYGTVNNNLEWVDYPTRPGETTYQDNQYAPHVLTAHMELMRGDTQLTFQHAAGESRRGEMIAKIAEARYRVHKQHLFSATKLAQENMSLLLNGVALRYTFNKWKPSGERVPYFEESESAGDSATICVECGAPKGDHDECFTCGGDEFESITAKFKAKKVSRYEQGQKACVDWHSPDPMGILFDIHAPTMADTAYLIWKQAIPTAVLQAKFPKTKIIEGIQSNELRDAYTQGSSTPNSSVEAVAGQNSDAKGVAEFAQGWFEPSLYAHYVLRTDVTLRSGKKLPAGTKLGEAFPDGLYLAKIGDTFEDLQNESKNDKWTCAPYVTRLGTMIGLGTSVILEGQDRLNDIINLQHLSILNDSFRREIINGQYLSNEDLPNDPRQRAVINQAMPDNSRIVGTAIDVLPASSLSSDAYAVPEAVKGSMQNQLGTFSSSASGMPDLKAAQNTASGMALFRELTVGRFYPMLLVRADSLDREQAYQLLLNDQKHLTPKDWQRFAGDYGHEAIEEFLKCDLREELLINVVPESFMPQTPSQKLQRTVEYYQFAGQTAGLLDQEAAAYVAEQFGMPARIVGVNAAYSMAQEQIEALSEVATRIIAEVGDAPTYDLANPQTMELAGLVVLATGIPIVPELDDTAVCIDAIRDYWRTDAGRSASNLLKATLILRVEQLKQAAAQGVTDDVLLAQQAEAPIREAEMAQQNEAMAMQAGQQQAANAAQLEAQAMQQEAEAAKVEQDREFQATMKMADMAEAQKQRDHETRQARMAEFAGRG